MAAESLTWGDIKKFMELGNVSDDANINLEIGIEGITPKLAVSGWVNNIERRSTDTIILRHNPKS